MLKILSIVETRYLKGNRTCSQTRSPVNPAGRSDLSELIGQQPEL